MKKYILGLLSILMISFSSVVFAWDGVVIDNDPPTNVRCGPAGTEENKIVCDKVNYGKHVNVVKQDGNWYYVEYIKDGELSGWIHKNLVDPLIKIDMRGRVVGNPQLYEGPGVSPMRLLETNTPLQVIGQWNNWYCVKILRNDGIINMWTAWVDKNYVQF